MANLLKDLPVLTDELKSKLNIQPTTGLRLAALVEANSTEKLKLLDVNPRYQSYEIDGKTINKGGYIFGFLGNQFLVKSSIAEKLKVNQTFTPEIREYQGNKYVVAV
jgi:hypothetical protein